MKQQPPKNGETWRFENTYFWSEYKILNWEESVIERISSSEDDLPGVLHKGSGVSIFDEWMTDEWNRVLCGMCAECGECHDQETDYLCQACRKLLTKS